MVGRFLERSTYNVGRTAFRNHLAEQAQARARRGVTLTPQAIDQAVDRIWPSLTPQAFLRDFFGSRDRVLAAAGDDFTAAEVSLLLRPASTRVTDETWSDADVALMDEAEFLIQGVSRQYRHVVVDEAQDLSPMQLRSVSRRAPDGSLTVVGDMAQGTGAWARDSWDDIVEALRVGDASEVVELDLGYRVPRQVYEFAAQLLPYAAPGLTPPTVVREGPAAPELIENDSWYLSRDAVEKAQEHAGKGRFVGIVCPRELREELEDELMSRDIAFGDVSKGDLTASINVMTAEESKGLEFDAVVVVYPELIAQREHGHRLLYIAMTRTTKYLTVVHAGEPLGLHVGRPVEVTTIEASEPPVPAETPIADTGMSERDTTTATPVPGLLQVVDAEPADDFARQLARQVAHKHAQEIRSTLAPSLLPVVLRYLHEELLGDEVQ